MYNMDISIFGYKINLEILILIGVIYLILVGHTVCGCCNFHGIIEGLEATTNQNINQQKNKTSMDMSKPATEKSSGNSLAATKKNPKASSIPSSVQSASKKEGFVGANTNYGESAAYSLSDPDSVDTTKWGMPSLVVTPGQPIPKAAQNIIDRPNQMLPLPEDQLSLFDNMPFSPECCPNTYSSSMGCACMNSNTYNYLISRGGNNVPYSEY